MDRTIKLERTIPLMVQRAEVDEGSRHTGALIGNIHRKMLVLAGFEDIRFRAGERLIVRMVLDNEAVGYQTTVRHIVTDPCPLVLVTFPDELEVINLRKADRISVFLPADVRAKKEKEHWEEVHMIKAMVLNLSNGGCFVSSKRPIAEQDDINISFSLPGETFIHSLAGEVLECNPCDAVYSQRIKFAPLGINSMGLNEISNWITRNMSYAV